MLFFDFFFLPFVCNICQMNIDIKKGKENDLLVV